MSGSSITFSSGYVRVYFGSKLVSQDGTHPMIQDNMESLRVDASGNKGGFYPYGDDKGTPLANDQVKFATYTRDSATGLDYAVNRYYSRTGLDLYNIYSKGGQNAKDSGIVGEMQQNYPGKTHARHWLRC